MRITPAILIAATFAATLSAQAPLRGGRGASTVLQTVTFDVAGAIDGRYRATTEAFVFGRFTIGLSGEYGTHAENQPVFYPVGGACPLDMLCAGDVSGLNGPQYRAWNFNLHGRWYPAVLSFETARQSASVYIGEFIGYHERRIREPLYYGCPLCAGPLTLDSGMALPDTSGVVIYPPPPYQSFTQKLHGWEPGAEFGVRMRPARHVVIDVGGTFRLETITDPLSGVQPGGLVKRMTVAVGVGW